MIQRQKRNARRSEYQQDRSPLARLDAEQNSQGGLCKVSDRQFSQA
jgi:hypothetical protein